jgi:hypothetical protein
VICSTSAVLSKLRRSNKTFQCISAGQEVLSRDGDSNPGPAHYEQSHAERCARRRYRRQYAEPAGAAGAELSAELARLARLTLSKAVN